MLDHGIPAALDNMIPGENYVYGQILVLVENEEEALLAAEAFCGELHSYHEGLAIIALDEFTVAQAVKASLSGQYLLPVASPNYITCPEPEISKPVSAFRTGVPTEMDWSDWVQTVMDNPDPALENPSSFDYQYHHDVIDSYAAWGATGGRNFITVAVIDTGVQSDHPDLNVREQKVYSLELTGDNNGHGTNVCGIIAAAMNNGLGGVGIAPNITLHSYRVADAKGKISDDAIYNAIIQAALTDADIINMSLGSKYYNPTIQDAIDYAVNQYGVTIVASMGNDGTNAVCYPAAYNHVIAVAATDKSNRRAYFSNYGSWCDISAPGVDIYSTYPGSGYDWMSGTSQAAPIVTGAIALYMSYFGNPGPAKMEKILESAATKCSDSGMGAGIVNAANMLDAKPNAPTFNLLYNGDVLYDYGAYNGATVPCETQLNLATYNVPDDWYVLYTLDGKTPSIKNGQIVAGTRCTNVIDLSPYAGSTVTVKAMQVSGLGIPGKVMTKKIKVAESKLISSISVSGPQTVVAGKSGQFSATVHPESTADQDVIWGIQSCSGSNLSTAAISQKGVLTTRKNASGTIILQVTSAADTSISATYSVNVQAVLPVSKVKLSKSSAIVYAGDTLQLNAIMTDKNGEPISTAGSRWTSSSKSIATVDGSGKVTAIKSGKVTITCKALDGSGKSAKCTITVKQQVNGLTITGNTAAAPNSSTALKVSAAPSNASSKSVVWSLDSAPYGVTVSSSGVVKVPSSVVSGTVKVRVTAKDGRGAYDTHTLTIQPKITSITLDSRFEYNGWASGFARKNEKLTSVTLFSLDLDESDGQDNFCALKAVISGPTVDRTWTSSNPAVASISGDGYITAHKAGTAKITCKPLDGSKKSATVTVKVINPVSYLDIKTSAAQMTNSLPYIGFGKSVTNKVVFGDTYGIPGDKHIHWDYTVTQIDLDGTKIDRTDIFKNNNLVSITSKAKDKTKGTSTVKVSSEAVSDWKMIDGEFRLTLYAIAMDGTSAFAYKDFLLIPPCSKLRMIENTRFKAGRNQKGLVCFESDQWHSFQKETNSGFIATSSNPKICSVGQFNYDHNLSILPCRHYNYPDEKFGSLHGYDLYIYTGSKKGTATITIRATDGSNKSCKFTITVK